MLLLLLAFLNVKKRGVGGKQGILATVCGCSVQTSIMKLNLEAKGLGHDRRGEILTCLCHWQRLQMLEYEAIAYFPLLTLRCGIIRYAHGVYSLLKT